MDKADIPFLSASDLSRLIEAKEVSPLEATEAYLDRIDVLDFKFNAYLTVARKQALEAAKDAEQEIARGNYRGPMHGVPVAVKDQFWTQGVRTTGGSGIYADFVPEEDATVIANLKRAGAVVLGKTNLTEFAIGGGFQRFSVPRNPWDLDTFTGSSSSGSGAATAAYLCATSLGEDTGGSIRFPASWCGLVGMKPSWGRVSRYGVMRGIWSMDTVGPMSRTVEDAAITLEAIAGHDPKDPYTWDIPVPDYRRSLDGDLRGLRIGLVTELTHNEVVDTEVREAVITATSVLGELGATVEEVSVPLARQAMLLTIALLTVEPASTHHDLIRERLQDYLPGNRIGLLTGSIMPAQAYYKTQKLRALLRQQTLDALSGYDVLVMPTVGRTAENIETFAKGSLLRRPYLQTPLFNLANSPSATLPCGFGTGNMPIGLQIGARPGADETVLKVAHAYEQAAGWYTRHPDLS
jgi:aspartyl-tRNA(Asn)/glutamyl-tRNA(Gln) amidotransferase subunit A